MMQQKNMRKDLLFFFALVAFVGLGNGFSDSVFSNYFKEVYDVTTTQRALIEFPRELPGVICVIIIAALSFLGDLRLALLAQVCSFIGLLVLGIWTPSFSIMLIFLFINSLGMHVFMPIQDSLSMALADPNAVGTRIAQYTRIKTIAGFVAGLIVFFGFRSGIFSFAHDTKYIFLLGCFFFLLAAISVLGLMKHSRLQQRVMPPQKMKLIFRKEYKLYYCLTILRGVQKQVAFVFGSWVIIDLLGKGADTISILLIGASFLGIFLSKLIGRGLDKFGIKTMMYVDALSFIFVYATYGFSVLQLEASNYSSLFAIFMVHLLFVFDRLSMQVGIVQAVYLRSIALSPEEVTPTLSTGLSLDHVVSIFAAQLSGLVWTFWGPEWVFFIAAFLSIGNVLIAWSIKSPEKTTA